jgi:uncharacterized protein (TIRG00374 family)
MICTKNNKCKTIAKVFFASVLVFLLIISVDWQQVWNYVVDANWWLIALSAVFYLLGIFISSRKWQILAQFKKFNKKYPFYFKTYLLGTFINNFLPSFVGGDTYRSYALGSGEKRIAESSSTVIIDRISGLISVMALAIILSFTQFDILKEYNLIIFIILGLVAVFVGIIIVVVASKHGSAQKVTKHIPKTVRKYLGYLVAFHHTDIMPRAMGYAFLFDFVGIAIANYLLFLAIGVELTFVQFLSVVFLTNIIASIPVSVGNIGIKEWAYVFLFGIFGVGGSAAVTVVILARVLQMLVSLVAIPFYLQNKQKLQHKQ